MWDLAELDNAAVREQLLDQWFRSQDSFEQANRRNALGLRAAGELNPDIRQRLIADAVELALRLAEAMEKETDADRLSILGDALAALAARLEPRAAPIVVEPPPVWPRRWKRKPTRTGSAVSATRWGTGRPLEPAQSRADRRLSGRGDGKGNRS